MILDADGQVYVGGVSNLVVLPQAFNSLNASRTFQGCISNANVDGVSMVPDTNRSVVQQQGIVNCTDVSFTMAGDFARAFGFFAPQSTSQATVALQFYTARGHAAIVSIPGPAGRNSQFITLGLRDGRLVLSQDLGAGVISATWSAGAQMLELERREGGKRRLPVAHGLSYLLSFVVVRTSTVECMV